MNPKHTCPEPEECEHYNFYIVITVLALLFVVSAFVVVSQEADLQTLGDAICAESGHSAFVSFHDTTIKCKSPLAPHLNFGHLRVETDSP